MQGTDQPVMLRIGTWTIAALVLLLPLVAMQFTDEVKWDATDFAFAGALIVGTGVIFELAVRRTNNNAYRGAVGVRSEERRVGKEGRSRWWTECYKKRELWHGGTSQ